MSRGAGKRPTKSGAIRERQRHAQRNRGLDDSNIYFWNLKQRPPAPTDDVCPGCKMAATFWPTRREFRAHIRGCGGCQS